MGHCADFLRGGGPRYDALDDGQRETLHEVALVADMNRQLFIRTSGFWDGETINGSLMFLTSETTWGRTFFGCSAGMRRAR